MGNSFYFINKAKEISKKYQVSQEWVCQEVERVCEEGLQNYQPILKQEIASKFPNFLEASLSVVEERLVNKKQGDK
jgi:hypothetical protein